MISDRSGAGESGVIVLLPIVAILAFVLTGLPSDYFIYAILAIVVFFVAFLNTDLALYILIMAMLWSPQFETGTTAGRAVKIRVDDVLLIVIFCGWLAKLAVNKELAFIKHTPLNAPIFVYMLINIVSSLLGLLEGRLNHKASFFFLLKYFEYFLLFFMVANNLTTFRQARRYTVMLLVVCLAVCLFAWQQIPAGGRTTTPFESEAGEPATLAAYLQIMMSIMAGFILNAVSFKHFIAMSGIFVMAAIVFVFTMSRGAWLSFIPMYMTIVFNARKWRAPMMAILVVVLISLPFILPERVIKRAQETFAPEKAVRVMGRHMVIAESAAERINAWPIAIERLKVKPILGWGVPAGIVVDNQYTRILGETGLLGMAAFIWIIATLYKVGIRCYRTTENYAFAQAVSLGLIAGLTGLLVQSLSSAVFILIRVMEPLWFIAAMVVAMPDLIAEHENREVRVEG